MSCGVGYPVASQRSRTLLPSGEVIFVAEVITDGLRHCSNSALWNKIPARLSGPLHETNGSRSTTEVSTILENSISFEMRQSQNHGLSWKPEARREAEKEKKNVVSQYMDIVITVWHMTTTKYHQGQPWTYSELIFSLSTRGFCSADFVQLIGGIFSEVRENSMNVY